MLSVVFAIAVCNLVGCQQPLFKNKTGLGGLFDKDQGLSELISDSTASLPPESSLEDRLENLGISKTSNHSTTKQDTRIRGRQLALRVSSDAISDNWRYGTMRFDGKPDGMRG